MQTVFVSIGTNINAEANMLLVKESLNSLFDVIYSSIYKTPAEGFEGEDFLNSVCKFDTDKNPQELRTLLKNIEKDMGRTFTQKGMSNRVIDLDLILYGDLQINRNGLELPSSDIEKYKFVLEPLAEIAPDYIHPILKKSYKDLLQSSFL
jgi:2-amino-4-hydroxy-6-hydroxymethyldihydropteridine diphosphokinase|tara:strand:- start:5895 stop:6344 length:450 start_codon:yes stop_codon:yes gene_type:complete